MAIVRHRSNELQCKIVYYGPGRGGKTTNLIAIHKRIGKRARGDLICINTAGDRTIFFDFLPMDLGKVQDLSIKISVYTVPGQVLYNDTRKLVLRGVDGIVFVADSLEIRRRQNRESLENLADNLKALGGDLSNIPLVMQYNKRDIEPARLMTVAEMHESLLVDPKWPWFPASALMGSGVKETFRAICMLTVSDVCKKLLVTQ